jgi:hypothetical protein
MRLWMPTQSILLLVGWSNPTIRLVSGMPACHQRNGMNPMNGMN